MPRRGRRSRRTSEATPRDGPRHRQGDRRQSRRPHRRHGSPGGGATFTIAFPAAVHPRPVARASRTIESTPPEPAAWSPDLQALLDRRQLLGQAGDRIRERRGEQALSHVVLAFVEQIVERDIGIVDDRPRQGGGRLLRDIARYVVETRPRRLRQHGENRALIGPVEHIAQREKSASQAIELDDLETGGARQ